MIRHLYTWPDSTLAYFEKENTIYAMNNKPEFFIADDGYVYDYLTREPKFSITDGHLYEIGKQQPTLYFAQE